VITIQDVVDFLVQRNELDLFDIEELCRALRHAGVLRVEAEKDRELALTIEKRVVRDILRRSEESK
jgi:hypothetical protein